MRIDHINIAAPWELLNAVRDFYCRALQLEEGPRPDFGIRGFWLYGDGKPLVHLIESDGHGPAEGPYYLDHVAFEMQDLPAYTARLDALGLSYDVRDFSQYGFCQVFCKDPCGNGVEANFPGAAAPA